MNRLDEIIEKTLTDLSNRKHKTGYIYSHSQKYKELKRYCIENHVDEYSEKTGSNFIEFIKIIKPHLKHHTMNEYRMAIRRINCTLTGTQWYPFVDKDIPFADSCYNDVVTEYEKYLYRKGKSKAIVRSNVHLTAKFLKLIEQQGCKKLKKLTPKHIFDVFKNFKNKSSFRSIISAFLRYAYRYSLIDVDMSVIVPGIPQKTRVPTVYSPEEVEKLLLSIERDNEIGKRNYAITLIAARLGLRAGDIAAMKFNCICPDTETIEIVQSKTKQALTLPLLEDVKAAINDYVENARPPSVDEHIFLKMRGYGSILPQTITSNIRRIFEKSGINLNGRRHGPHALRSSLASALLAEGNDFSAIQKVLGQKDIQSTRSYVRADIEMLRTNALPIPAPSENYERLLAGAGAAV